MDLSYQVNMHDKYGDITEEGVYIQFGDMAYIRFDDPLELSQFLEVMQNSLDDIVEDWNAASTEG